MQENSRQDRGILYIVATHIGNMEDISIRAIRILKEVDVIAAEDTRHSKILLNAYSIKTPLISLHEHNEKEKSRVVVSRILEGSNVAYISDAGSPCVSDPGHHLVRLALENRINVVPIPGPSALIAALSVCGFPADDFRFCGFLPAKENQRRRFLESIKHQKSTFVFYESPSRILGLLKDIEHLLGDRQIVVARELTKVFEEIRRGSVRELIAEMSLTKAKGEFTVILRQEFSGLLFEENEIKDKLLQCWSKQNMSLRDAVEHVVSQTGLSRKKVYDLAVRIRPVSDPC
jgi:16S rRNA (cytidine1402-2'-O)-methyltransferase